MSISVNTTPATMVLVGNPVKLDIRSDSLVTYQIKDGGNVAFTGSGEGSFFIFIQDILSTLVNPQQLHNESPNVLLPVAGTSKNITISAVNSQNEKASVNIKILLGGVSKRTLRRLNDENTNIFTYKLLNSQANFFQTTRSTGRVFCIRETELLPIPFIYPDTQIKVVASGITTNLPGTIGQPYALNLYRLRKNLFEQNNLLASVFDIYSGDTKSCTIIITPGTVSRERYLLEFLNSYGAYERIEVTGIGNLEREQEDESVYQVYDELVDDYIDHRERQSGRDSLIVESGFRSPQDLVFLIDMLSSDDITLLGFDGRSLKVNANAEELTRAVRATVPESIKLTLRFAESEQFHTGSFLDDDFGSPRIHTEQFTQEFN